MELSCVQVATAAMGEPVRRQGVESFYRCPFHQDSAPSLRINADKNCWNCFPCQIGGSAWQLAAKFADCDPGDKSVVKAWLQEHGLSTAPAPASQVVATYDYVAEDGALLYQKLRFQPKRFAQRRPDGNGAWVENLDGVRRVPYGLPELLASDQCVYVEGEKDVQTARSIGFVATTAGSVASWVPTFAQHFTGKHVIVIPDADEPGRRHARQVASDIISVASGVQLLELPAKDLSEYVEKGGTKDSLLQLIDQTRLLKAADVAKWKVADPEPLIAKAKTQAVAGPRPSPRRNSLTLPNLSRSG
jgi:putative DNA primase/helicase